MKAKTLAGFLFCLPLLASGPSSAELVGELPYLPHLLRAVVIGNSLGDFDSRPGFELDEFLHHRRPAEGALIDMSNTLYRLTINQLEGFLELGTMEGGHSLKLWPIGRQEDDQYWPNSADTWLMAHSHDWGATVGSFRHLRFFRVHYRGRGSTPPTIEPLDYSEVLPLLSEDDFFSPGPPGVSCFLTDPGATSSPMPSRGTK